MKRATKLVIALGTALTLGLGAAAISAQPFGYGQGCGTGPGMMGGYGGQGGGGRMGGYGPSRGMGPGMMGGYGGQGWGGRMGGYGPGYGMGPGMMGGYGPGWGGHMGGYGPGYGMGPGMMGGYGQGRGGHMGGYRQGNADENLAALKTELGITAQQDVAWQAFAKNAKQQSENRPALFAKMREARDGAKSAPELLAQQSEFMKQRQLEMAANAAALKDLYAALTPEQKVIADQRFGGFGPGRIQGNRTGPRGYAR